MQSEAERIAERLTWAQKQMVLRGPGKYQDSVADLAELLDAGILGTCEGPQFSAVREVLMRPDA